MAGQRTFVVLDRRDCLLVACDMELPARQIRFLLAVLLACGGCGTERGEYHQDEEHFRVIRESPYTTIIVERNGSTVDMRFRLSRHAPRQSAIDLHDPENLILPYTRAMLAGAFILPEPRRILLIGLGGGALNRFLRLAYPDVEMTSVELDPMVVQSAIDYMDYQPTEHEEVIVEDGRAFIKDDKSHYDWILVDAYGSGAVPPHLKTREFYDLLLRRLSPGGVVVFNIHRGNKLFHSDQATLKAVFPEVHLFAVPGTGNIIALAYISPSPDFAGSNPWPKNDTKLAVYLSEVWPNYQGPAAKSGGPVLTDEFAPTETLQREGTE